MDGITLSISQEQVVRASKEGSSVLPTLQNNDSRPLSPAKTSVGGEVIDSGLLGEQSVSLSGGE